MQPPTAHLETDAALAVLVFGAIIWFGIRAGGVRGYLGTFATPSIVMVPLNLIESITRTFAVRPPVRQPHERRVRHQHHLGSPRRLLRRDRPGPGGGASRGRAMDAIARQPESASTISRTLFVGLAMIETMAIYCLVIALLLLFANPLLK